MKIKKIFEINKEFFKVSLDLTFGSGYEYNKDSKVPTQIKFGRIYSSKFQKGKILTNVTNEELHNIIFMLKRGYGLSEINDWVIKNSIEYFSIKI